MPPQCPLCARRVSRGGAVCRACGRRWAREQRRARIESPRRVVPGRDAPFRIHAAGSHVGAWARLVQLYKAEREPALAALVEGFAWGRLEGALSGSDPGRRAWVPVPMARVRRRERGRNPAEELARAWARRAGGIVAPRALERVRYRRPLRGLSRREREREMEGAVTVGREVPRLTGEEVWLVDDVCTTGATLSAVGRALASAGIEVRAALVLSRTPFRPSRGVEPRRRIDPSFHGA